MQNSNDKFFLKTQANYLAKCQSILDLPVEIKGTSTFLPLQKFDVAFVLIKGTCKWEFDISL